MIDVSRSQERRIPAAAAQPFGRTTPVTGLPEGARRILPSLLETPLPTEPAAQITHLMDIACTEAEKHT